MPDSLVRDRILEAAEIRARAGGYNGFSFRDLAGDIGIKSASVHYHFPTKEVLAEALARRYTDRARASLAGADDLPAHQAVARVVDLFRTALAVEDRMCLCGLFGAERDALPEPVRSAVADYFRMLLAYLDRAGVGQPAALLARLEGALILARVLSDRALFDSALADLG